MMEFAGEFNDAFFKELRVQETKDMLEQISKLKAIDTKEKPELQVVIAETLVKLYRRLAE